MIHNSAIYSNPVIPADFYFTKIAYVETEPADFPCPKILVHLLLHPDYALPKDTFLTSIIHPTEKSIPRGFKS